MREICNFTINRDQSNKKVEKLGQSFAPAAILVDILIPAINGLGIKMSTRTSAGVNNYPCFATFYFYDCN